MTAASPILSKRSIPFAKDARVAGTTVAGVLMVVLLLAVPLPFGSVQVWAWATIGVVSVGLLFCWAIACKQRQEIRVRRSPLYLFVGLFLLLGLMQLLTRLTFDAVATREALIKLSTSLILFFLAGQLFDYASGRFWLRFGLTMLFYAFLLSLFAIFQLFSNPDALYWSIKPRSGGYIFGPYVNHNHYAGLMEMLVPISIAFLLSRSKHEPWRWLAWFAVVVSLASVFLSGSRGGLISLLAESMLFGGVLSWRWRHLAERGRTAAASLSLVSALGLFLWAAPPNVFARLPALAQSSDVSFADRRQIALDSLHMFQEHPWLGTGLGSFETAYPRYQSIPTDLVIDHAHNDFLEALAEAGLAGGVLILAILGHFFRKAFRLIGARSHDAASWIRLGAGIGCCGVLVHSFMDFNLHIPANATWMAFCAGLATSSPVENPMFNQRPFSSTVRNQ